MEFRVGINVGDVIVEDPQLYGHGVNIATRAQTQATRPGPRGDAHAACTHSLLALEPGQVVGMNLLYLMPREVLRIGHARP
jgi:hypothetical protein